MADVKPLVQAGGAVQEMASSDRVVGHVVSATVTAIVVLTQAAYDALGTPDPNTLYVIDG